MDSENEGLRSSSEAREESSHRVSDESSSQRNDESRSRTSDELSPISLNELSWNTIDPDSYLDSQLIDLVRNAPRPRRLYTLSINSDSDLEMYNNHSPRNANNAINAPRTRRLSIDSDSDFEIFNIGRSRNANNAINAGRTNSLYALSIDSDSDILYNNSTINLSADELPPDMDPDEDMINSQRIALDVESPLNTSQLREHSQSLEYCAICCDVMLSDHDLKYLPCRHSFHRACIRPWFAQQRTCPNCRKPVP